MVFPGSSATASASARIFRLNARLKVRRRASDVLTRTPDLPRFVAFHMESPHELGTEHVRTWALHLLQVKGRNANTVNVAIMALRFLFGTTFQRPEVTASVRVVRTHSPQPDVPSGSQVAKAASREILAALAGRCPADHGLSVNPRESVPTTVPRWASYWPEFQAWRKAPCSTSGLKPAGTCRLAA